ncbi:MAG TPA: sensor histidine kinase [Candidatus Avacidaminococcus intestinavium]|uniref:histidine kinase n=1 Tax=Candidatus Avacidaminococcus intestinavium TaxID=2840684 RepID=A0A9D1SLE6_9FIRM|nr:sensor histidine kinase [Candidatus Avacidaminococcus intestinavium]
MFKKTRKKLTLRYAKVMVLFMLAFIFTSSVSVFVVLYQEEKYDLLFLAEEEALKQVKIIRSDNGVYPLVEQNSQDEEPDVFYYVLDRAQQVVTAKDASSAIRGEVLNIIDAWNGEHRSIELKRINLTQGEQAVILLCSIKMYDENQEVGTLFMGEDVSVEYQILKMMLHIMIFVSFIFLIIAAFAEHFLAKKAMLPIKQAFIRQREFIADASHELRTPLSVLQLSVEAVQKDTDQQLSTFSTQVLADMNIEIHRMTKLVADLLTLARADDGISNIMKKRFDLIVMLETLIRSLQSLAAAKAIKLSFKADEKITIMADPERITQLLVILLDNAIKYTPKGGIVEVIVQKAVSTKPSVCIIVKDSGVGIAESDLSLIFERFYRVDKARVRDGCGSGLGLAIAKWIVGAHDGKIQVQSNRGVGSSFIITLPL